MTDMNDSFDQIQEDLEHQKLIQSDDNNEFKMDESTEDTALLGSDKGTPRESEEVV